LRGSVYRTLVMMKSFPSSAKVLVIHL